MHAGPAAAAVSWGWPNMVRRVMEALTAGPLESGLVQTRRQNPDGLFDLMAQMIAAGYAQRLGASSPQGS